jgi:hypothetical protein
MEVVARYLVSEVQRINVPADRDQFGRSAFNRFYYAAFLLVRTELKPVVGSWPNSHSGIPPWLRGSVLKELNRGVRLAERIDDEELRHQCESAKAAAIDLSRLMENSYSVRVVADYDPEIPVEFGNHGEFQLNTIKVAEAQAWPHRARTFARAIALAWRQINV